MEAVAQDLKEVVTAVVVVGKAGIKYLEPGRAPCHINPSRCQSNVAWRNRGGGDGLVFSSARSKVVFVGT
jgi:hypothetical protein